MQLYLFIYNKAKDEFCDAFAIENAKNAAYASYKLKRDFNDT